MANIIRKEITVAKHNFTLEVYPMLVDWEIFAHDYNGCLYALENKEKLNKLIKDKHIYEPRKK